MCDGRPPLDGAGAPKPNAYPPAIVPRAAHRPDCLCSACYIRGELVATAGRRRVVYVEAPDAPPPPEPPDWDELDALLAADRDPADPWAAP